MQKQKMRFGNEVFFDSVIVGRDEKDVVYIRTTGLHGPVQVARIKPSEYAAVVAHMASRITQPVQGTKRQKRDFTIVEPFERTEFGEDEPETVDIPANAVFRVRSRAPVRVLEVEPQPQNQTQYRVRRRMVKESV